MTEDEIVGWHHQLSGHDFEQAPGDGEGQDSLQSMGSQRVGQGLVTEQQQRERESDRDREIERERDRDREIERERE